MILFEISEKPQNPLEILKFCQKSTYLLYILQWFLINFFAQIAQVISKCFLCQSVTIFFCHHVITYMIYILRVVLTSLPPLLEVESIFAELRRKIA